MMTSGMYQENIIDHYRSPRNKGKLEHADVQVSDTNPLCGDVITLELRIEDDRIADARFMGTGCAISQSAVSMLTEKLIGMPLEDAEKIDKDYILRLLGIEISPARNSCAMLSLKVLKLAVYSYKAQKIQYNT